jgi:hypothetical protein
MSRTLGAATGFLILALGLFSSPLARPADLLEFHSPTWEEPYYRIQFRFVVKNEKTLIKGLELNGKEAGPFLVFKDGKNIDLANPLAAGTYAIVLDHAWAAAKSYEAKLVYQPEKAKKPRTAEIRGLSPKEGGIPGGKEGFYRVYQVGEEAGVERHHELVTLTLVAPKHDLDPPNLAIFDGLKPIPFEILESKDSVPAEAVASAHPQTSTLKIALPIDAEPDEKKLLLILEGDRGPAPTSGLAVSGQGLGKTIKSSRLALELHPQSGQINVIESLEAGVRLFNKAGVIHWNPDVFVPGIAWDHSFDWNPPAIAEEKTGAFFYLNSRRGPLPRIRGVRLEVKYTLAADAPYFISETKLDFEEGVSVIAVRNDEMVLFRDLFDSLTYRDKKGEIIKRPLQEKEGAPFGLVHVAPEDLGWVGLINTRERYGFFSLRLLAAHGNLELPGEFLHRAGTYFYAPSDGDYVYWVRPFVYTWADYFTNTHLSFVPKGSFFYEKNAYIVMRLDEDLPQKLELLLMKLRNPLRTL